MPAVKLVSGNPTMVDYIPTANGNAGDVVVVSDTPRIAHKDMVTGVLAALAAEGGVYEGVADAAIGSDIKVFWDSALKKVTATAGTFKVLGVTVTATAAPDQKILFRHDPSA